MNESIVYTLWKTLSAALVLNESDDVTLMETMYGYFDKWLEAVKCFNDNVSNSFICSEIVTQNHLIAISIIATAILKCNKSLQSFIRVMRPLLLSNIIDTSPLAFVLCLIHNAFSCEEYKEIAPLLRHDVKHFILDFIFDGKSVTNEQDRIIYYLSFSPLSVVSTGIFDNRLLAAKEVIDMMSREKINCAIANLYRSNPEQFIRDVNVFLLDSVEYCNLTMTTYLREACIKSMELFNDKQNTYLPNLLPLSTLPVKAVQNAVDHIYSVLHSEFVREALRIVGLPLLIVFLSGFHSDTALWSFVSNRNNIITFGLPDVWYFPQQRPRITFTTPPCAAYCHAPLHQEYERLRILLCNDSSTVQSLTMWANSFSGTNIYTARMLLVNVIYNEIFSVSETCFSALCALDDLDFKKALNLSDDEASMIKVIANGPHNDPCDAKSGLMFYFTNLAMRSDNPSYDIIRSHAVSCLAMVLGSNPSSCYYHMCMFSVENLKQTLGLGSGNRSLFSDKGYRTKYINNELVFDDVENNISSDMPFESVIEHRALNNYFVWMSISWGLWVTFDRFTPYLSSLIVDPTEYSVEHYTLMQHRYSYITFNIANNFLTMIQSNEVSLSRIKTDINLYVTLCSFYTSVCLSSCTENLRLFHINDATCHFKQKRAMKLLSKIWFLCEENLIDYNSVYTNPTLILSDSITDPLSFATDSLIITTFRQEISESLRMCKTYIYTNVEKIPVLLQAEEMRKLVKDPDLESL